MFYHIFHAFWPESSALCMIPVAVLSFLCGVRMKFVKKYLICGEEGAVEAVLGFFNVDFW